MHVVFNDHKSLAISRIWDFSAQRVKVHLNTSTSKEYGSSNPIDDP